MPGGPSLKDRVSRAKTAGAVGGRTAGPAGRVTPMSTLDAHSARHVELVGCFNFRDLGGYPTTDGRRTRWRCLFRADGLDNLVDADHGVLAGLGIRTVIDLRTEAEVAGLRPPADAGGSGPAAPTHSSPPTAGAGAGANVRDASYHHLPLTEVLPGEEDAPQWGDPRFVSERYGGMLRDGSASVVTALRLLAAPGGLPAVFHCSVGKDRTGVLAAVVLGLLGVPDDVIVEDYALSRAAMTRLLESLRVRYPDASEIVDRYEPVILSVEPPSMQGFLGEVRREHGTFDALARHLGVDDLVETLRTHLLEPAA